MSVPSSASSTNNKESQVLADQTVCDRIHPIVAAVRDSSWSFAACKQGRIINKATHKQGSYLTGANQHEHISPDSYFLTLVQNSYRCRLKPVTIQQVTGLMTGQLVC